jgi:hypothetical protein
LKIQRNIGLWLGWTKKRHLNSNDYFINIEPTLTMKAGGEKLKGILQFGVTIPTINSHSYFMVNTSSMLGISLFKLSIGIAYAFGKK